MDQWTRSGHGNRLEDLDRIASLGIRTLRQSVLWERVAPDAPDTYRWEQSDAILTRLGELGVEPIVGLLHHGSGPAYTSLVDPEFPEKLAQYARAVAERYPYVSMYTPVNEPLTTARFSGLYGHWYPHGRDGLTFAKALLNEVKGTVLAMREIRKVNPHAQLVQTEDLGKTYATQELQYQAAFENDRRWSTWDLLCGTFDGENRLYEVFRKEGVSEAELAWFRENPCPPDILGINTYVTSERFLDHRIDRYPQWTHGGNGRHRYADVEAVRVLAGGIDGPGSLLQEAADRYRLPVAITECHLGCTREEQVRWLKSVWQSATERHESGVDVRAVTVWSLFGAYDWNSLLCRDIGCYEPGAFDLSGDSPRETALAGAIRQIAAGDLPSEPWVEGPGWWERPTRLLYPAVVVRTSGSDRAEPAPAKRRTESRPLLIVGNGPMADAFARWCEIRGLAYRPVSVPEADPACAGAVAAILDSVRPWAVINAFGYEHVGTAEQMPTLCYRDNTVCPMLFALACASRGIRLVTFSTDLVFDGLKRAPYVESDVAWPDGTYGRSKWEAEYRVAESGADALVVRTGPCFGPTDRRGFMTNLAAAMAEGRTFGAGDDQTVSPTYLPDLARATLDLLQDGERGIWHLANEGAVTWNQLAREAACLLGADPARIEAVSESGRPRYLALGSERGALMPSLEDALARWVDERSPAPSDADVSAFLA
jgi:dTDP-4-dehydrorhamnose reductase